MAKNWIKLGIVIMISGSSFLIGRITAPVKIKEVKKEKIVYDLSREPKLLEAYANMLGMTLQKSEDIQKEKEKMLKVIEEEQQKKLEVIEEEQQKKLEILEQRYNKVYMGGEIIYVPKNGTLKNFYFKIKNK